MEEDWIDELATGRPRIVGFAVAVEGGMGILAWIAGLLLGLPVAGWVVWSGEGLAWGMAGAVAMLALLGICRAVPRGPLAELNRLVDRLVKGLFGGCRWWELLAIALLAGWGEEMVFRGVIQGGLEVLLTGWFPGDSGWWPEAVALAVASVLFGLAHCVSREYVAFAIVVGALLGWMAIATGDLLAPMVAHAVYDFVALMWLVRRP
ncbi:MAG: CPBP family intramembrane metalloprotease [Akkermansiaceae bacterium]|nr:CPBP family intramembrane metalloprotease [Akkermansiaceae bacterium]NNM27952.1 CPBP family intramembrane metalloprotease [Akkermansiaceae bacterium]